MSDIEKTAGKIKSVSENHRRISQNLAKIGVGAQELISSMSLSPPSHVLRILPPKLRV